VLATLAPPRWVLGLGHYLSTSPVAAGASGFLILIQSGHLTDLYGRSPALRDHSKEKPRHSGGLGGARTTWGHPLRGGQPRGWEGRTMTGFDCYPLVYGGHRSVLSPEPTNAKMRRPDGPVIPTPEFHVAPHQSAREHRLVINVADSVPRFDVRPTCRSAISMMGSDPARSVEQCVAGEERARKDLEKNWSKFPATDRSQCVGTATNHGSPSYEELQTCLDMMQDNRALRERERKQKLKSP
jgi:hypothetical protein